MRAMRLSAKLIITAIRLVQAGLKFVEKPASWGGCLPNSVWLVPRISSACLVLNVGRAGIYVGFDTARRLLLYLGEASVTGSVTLMLPPPPKLPQAPPPPTKSQSVLMPSSGTTDIPHIPTPCTTIPPQTDLEKCSILWAILVAISAVSSSKTLKSGSKTSVVRSQLHASRKPGSLLPDGLGKPVPRRKKVSFASGLSSSLATSLDSTLGTSPSTITSSFSSTCVSFTHLTTLGIIGKGSYGLITRVRDEDSGRVLVMKTISRSTLWFDGKPLAMHELEAMYAVGKHWYPMILGAFMTEQDVMLVMPYYARGDLRSFIKSTSHGCVSQELAKFWCAELILAIHGIHKAGLIHRDIKPENIFVDDARHIVLADFGVAHLFPDFPRSAETDFPLLFLTPSNPYRTSGVCGTPIYLPPEACSGEEYSFGMDYYSMGMVVHELITGTFPIDSASKRARESRGPFVINLRPNAYAPQDLDEPGKELLAWLLRPIQFDRPTVSEMKAHWFFERLNWELLAEKQLAVPSEKLDDSLSSQRMLSTSDDSDGFATPELTGTTASDSDGFATPESGTSMCEINGPATYEPDSFSTPEVNWLATPGVSGVSASAPCSFAPVLSPRNRAALLPYASSTPIHLRHPAAYETF